MIISDLCQGDTLANPAALTNSAVGMISFRTKWKTIQKKQPVGGPTNNPNDPSFDWTFPDSAFAQAATYGKDVWLRIFPQEFNAPGWIQNLIPQYIDTTGSAYQVWWDSTHLAYLTAMIQAVAARYGSNPRWKVFSCNLAAAGAGDWSFPHVQSAGPVIPGAANWGLSAGWVCPAYGGTVTVTPAPGSIVYPGWVVFAINFGYFIVQSVDNPTNATRVVLLNPGYPGNASSGNTGLHKVMQVSDQQQLESPAFNYTTAKLVNALNQIITVADQALPPSVVHNHEVGRNGTLDPYPGATSYQYNAATQMCQFGYANTAPGRFAMAKNGFTSQTPAPADAMTQQDGSNFYLLAQTVFGSVNTSGTTGSIPQGGLLNGQFSWNCYDPTGLYLPSTTGGQSPYQANGGIPYTDPVPVFEQTLAICQLYGIERIETYEVDIINILLPALESGAQLPVPPLWEDGPVLNAPYCGQNQAQQIQVPASVAYKEPPYAQEEGPWVQMPYAQIFGYNSQPGPDETWIPPPVKQTDIFTAQQTWPL
jgi:hypothetical protein